MKKTFRHHTDKDLFYQGENFKTIINSALDGFYIVNMDGRIVEANDSYCSMIGYSHAELLNMEILEIEGMESEEVIKKRIRRISEKGSERFETCHKRKDGSYILIDASVYYIKDEQGIFSVFVRDITERKRGETEFVIANKELLFQNEEKEKRAAELVAANKETIRHLQNIQALHKIDQAIAGSLDLYLTLNVVLEQVKTQLNIDTAAVLLLNPHTQILEFSSGFGFHGKAIERSRLRLGEGLCGRAALERRMIGITNLLENSIQSECTSLLADEGFVTCFVTPLIAKGKVNGVLEICHRSPFAPDENWLEFFRILAGQAAIAVDSASLFTDLIHSNAELFAAYDSTIEGWSHALDVRDKETEGHTQRVMEMTLKLARTAGISEKEMVQVRRGALLHDIGKMGVPDNILLKPDKLTDEEWVVMRKHTTLAFELLSPIAYLRPALDIPYCHHEKWDGSGYPRGLKGEQIPLTAQLFSIVDVYDALLSDRPYRQGWPRENVIEHVKSLSGTHFKPKTVELFLQMMNEE